MPKVDESIWLQRWESEGGGVADVGDRRGNPFGNQGTVRAPGRVHRSGKLKSDPE